MKRKMLKIICCPDCKGDLDLKIKKEVEKEGAMEGQREIIEGVLTCVRCGVDYPIDDGIPNLLPKNIKPV